ncbi:MAG: CBS domain-containing protein [Pseudobdellovibrionaceae bacterium]|nr:CBS domain-containing protein [Bdellovibrionales bacterium]USN48350.1 MAG: CBS domain-containing protein [Pseudobdellovibrionaceae bacterium]
MPLQRIKEIPVEEYSTPSPISVKPDTMVGEILDIMRTEGIRHVPVIDGNQPVGIISDGDLKLAATFKEAGRLRAGDIMTGEVYIVDPNVSLDEVVFKMSEKKLGSAIVLDPENDYMGIFTVTDALNALIEVLRGFDNN